MAFLFPFFLENRVLRVFLAFRCMPRGYVSLLNYNNKGLQWCGCSPFVKIWLIGKGSCRLCLCRGNVFALHVSLCTEGVSPPVLVKC